MRGNEKGGEEATGSVMREVGCCTNPSFHLAAFASNPSGRRLPMPPLTSAIFCPALSIDFGGLSHCKGLGGEGGWKRRLAKWIQRWCHGGSRSVGLNRGKRQHSGESELPRDGFGFCGPTRQQVDRLLGLLRKHDFNQTVQIYRIIEPNSWNN
jgi:hypothetical protein